MESLSAGSVRKPTESRRRGDTDSTQCRLRLWTSAWRQLVVPRAQGESSSRLTDVLV